MNVRINSGLSKVAALVSSATKSNNLDRLNRLNDSLDGLTEVGEGGSDTDLMVISWLLLREGLEDIQLSRDQLLGREILV